MRIKATALLTVGIGALQILASASDAPAADRELRSSKAHHRFGAVVADYDGTAIYLRRARTTVGRNYGFGTEVTRDLYDAYPVIDIYNPRMGPQPTRYLNGQRYP
jgi:hypothetical protein